LSIARSWEDSIAIDDMQLKGGSVQITPLLPQTPVSSSVMATASPLLSSVTLSMTVLMGMMRPDVAMTVTLRVNQQKAQGVTTCMMWRVHGCGSS
jgi:hypothetical protein